MKGNVTPPAAVLLATLLALTACSPPLEFADWTIPVPEGARIIGLPHVPMEERTDRIELVGDLVVGRSDDPQQQFYQAFGAAVDGTGNIYVMEYGNQRVQVFDHDGRYLRTLGSAGQGPGELQRPQHITVAGDAVVVVDPENARLNYWSTADGEYLGAEPLEERSLDVYGLDDGTLVGSHVIFHREPEFWRERMVGHFSRAGAELERYVVFRLFSESSIAVPYATVRVVATPAGDVYVTRADRYQILAFEADGTPRWALHASQPLVEVPQEIHDEAVRRLRERQPDYEAPGTWLEYMPAIGNMVVDGHGNLYVFHYAFTPRDPYTAEPMADSPDQYAVDVYSPDGELISAALSDRMNWSAAWGDYVYSLGRDPETEEEVVRRYRLVVPWD